MSKTLTLVLAQLNLVVGDIEGNTDRMLKIIKANKNADIVVFSELALTGYPPEDLLFRQDLYQRCDVQLAVLQEASEQIAIIVGHPWLENGHTYNALSVFWQGQLKVRYFKQRLPNYGVFDEMRYFTPGEHACVAELYGHKIGLLICEDLWEKHCVDKVKQCGAELIVSVNASPYNINKPHIRHQLLSDHCRRTQLPLIYLNQVGGQDELVFDGNSCIFNGQGQLIQQLRSFEEDVVTVTFEDLCLPPLVVPKEQPSVWSQIYWALVLAVRDYVTKNHFQGVVLGLSGGIDSALTLAIAVDALGKDKVQAVMMPFRYTADISIADAKEQANILNIKFAIISIEPIFDSFITQLAPLMAGTQQDTTEENLQARCRGVLLMAISNKKRCLVLTTGNKSEMAVGYATLYGDMAGGFDVLKDVPKTWVFKLAEYRNTLSYVIPQRVIDRPPSAELAPDQKDQDSLPAYDILDAIIERYIEHDFSVERIVADGFDEATVRKVIRLIDINEYKRRQAATGPIITTRSFGKERRNPITSGFGRKNW